MSHVCLLLAFLLFSLTIAYIIPAILNQLQNPGSIFSVHELDVVLNFDTVDPLVLFHDKEGPQKSSVQSAYAIQDAAAGLWHSTNVLSMLVDICMESATSHHATPAFQDYLAWLLDSFLVVHGLQKRFQANSTLHEFCKRSEVMSLCALQALLSTLRESLPVTILRKGCVLLSLLCVGLLENLSDLSDKSTPHNICSSLLTLAVVCKRHESTRRLLALYLVPAIRVSLNDDDSILKLGKDFQVCTENELQ